MSLESIVNRLYPSWRSQEGGELAQPPLNSSLSIHVLVRKFASKNTRFSASLPFWVNLKAKFDFLGLKIANCCPSPNFLTDDAAVQHEVLGQTSIIHVLNDNYHVQQKEIYKCYSQYVICTKEKCKLIKRCQQVYHRVILKAKC